MSIESFTVPASLRDIKLSQWQDYIDVADKNTGDESVEFLNKKLLSIFCDIPLKDVDKLGLGLFEDTLNHFNVMLNKKVDLVNRFSLIGTDGVTVHFGLIPNFDKMSYGEFQDIEAYLFDNKNLHKAMAVLYRPIKFDSKDSYLIHDYQGTSYMSDVMRNTPLDVVLGVRVFFYRLATKLGNYTMVSTLKELQEQDKYNKEKHSEKNGEVINQYLLSLEKMLEESKKLQDSPFINV